MGDRQSLLGESDLEVVGVSASGTFARQPRSVCPLALAARVACLICQTHTATHIKE